MKLVKKLKIMKTKEKTSVKSSISIRKIRTMMRMTITMKTMTRKKRIMVRK
jgi:hypothetical protein